MMNKRVPFMPIIGSLSGAACTVSGFILARSVKGIAESTAAPDISDYQNSYDIYSYFFGSSAAPSVDNGELLTSKLIELCGKGFGLILIFLGLMILCLFASKIEKALREPPVFMPPFDPYMPEPGFCPPNAAEAPFSGNSENEDVQFSDPVPVQPEQETRRTVYDSQPDNNENMQAPEYPENKTNS